LTDLLKGLASVYLCILYVFSNFTTGGSSGWSQTLKLRITNQSLNQLRKYAANFVDSVYFCFRWLDSPFKGRKFNFDFKLCCTLLTEVGWSLIIFFVYVISQFTTGGWIQTHKLGITSFLSNQLCKYAPGFDDCVYLSFQWLDSIFKTKEN